MKKIVSIMLIAAIAVTSAVALTACGSSNNTDPSVAATAATTATTATAAPTAAATQAATAAQQVNNADSNSGNADNTGNQSDNSGAEYAGITQDKAYTLALERSGSGAQVISCYQGTIAGGSQEGNAAWVVTVQESDGTQKSYYCGFPFCYNIESGDYLNPSAQDTGSEYAGISEDKAYSLALERAGEGAQVTGCYQGTIPSGSQAGDPAWVLSVTLADGTTKTYYAGYPFIYDADTL